MEDKVAEVLEVVWRSPGSTYYIQRRAIPEDPNEGRVFYISRFKLYEYILQGPKGSIEVHRSRDWNSAVKHLKNQLLEYLLKKIEGRYK